MDDVPEIVKICIKHGPLTKEQTKTCTKKRTGIVVSTWLKCRACMQAADLKYWHKNKGAKLARKKSYNEENKEKIRAQQREYMRKERSDLGDRYVASKLVGESKLKVSELKRFPELIELKRAVLKLKREVKTISEHKKYIRLARTCIGDSE